MERNWERNFKAREIKAEEWEDQHETFKQLYVGEGHTLTKVRWIMATEHNFYANESQYKRKIKSWKIEKNVRNGKKKDMIRLQNKRAPEGNGTVSTSPIPEKISCVTCTTPPDISPLENKSVGGGHVSCGTTMNQIDRPAIRYKGEYGSLAPSTHLSTSESICRTLDPTSYNAYRETGANFNPTAANATTIPETSLQIKAGTPVSNDSEPTQANRYSSDENQSPKGDFDKTFEWYGWILAEVEKGKTGTHRTTLDAIHNIAVILGSQGRYNEALELLERALVGYEKALGKDHPSTLYTVQNMVRLCTNQERFEEGLRLCQRALTGFEMILGKDHLSTLEAVSNMAKLHYRKGDNDEALHWFKRAHAGFEKTVGMEHPSTLDAINGMVLVFNRQRRFDEADELCNKTLAHFSGLFSDVLGEVAPMELVDCTRSMFRNQDEDGDLQICRQKLVDIQKSHGDNHPQTLEAVNRLSGMLLRHKQYDEAVELWEHTLISFKTVLGKEHPWTLESTNNIALVFRSLERYGESLALLNQAFSGYSKTLGEGHPWALQCMNDIAIVLRFQQRYDEALQWCEKALLGCMKNLGESHPWSLDVIDNMGLIFGNQGRYVDARECFRRALDGRKAVLGNRHSSTAQTEKYLREVEEKFIFDNGPVLLFA